MEAVLQLLGAGLLDLGAALVLGHLRALLADHLLEVVDLVLQLVLLVAQRRKLFQIMLDQVAGDRRAVEQFGAGAAEVADTLELW